MLEELIWHRLIVERTAATGPSGKMPGGASRTLALPKPRYATVLAAVWDEASVLA